MQYIYLCGSPDAGVVDPEVVAGDHPVPVEDVQPPLHHLHQPPVPREVGEARLQPGHRGHVPAVGEHGEAEQHQRGGGEGGAGEVVHRHQLHIQEGEGRLLELATNGGVLFSRLLLTMFRCLFSIVC